MKVEWKVLALLCAISLFHCVGDSSVKGEEDDPFDDYEEKEDSFFNPTQHGTLVFGLPTSAEIDDDHLFHAWDFTLVALAQVDLQVILVTPNLDTVMYLYRKDPESGNWGRYIARNDDAEGTVASRLTETLEAGDYRVLVKGFKRTLRGRFQLQAECSGAGCERGECDVEDYASLPDPVADSCGDMLTSAYNGTVSGQASTYVTLAERCSLPETARIGVELYYSYWDDIVGWEDAFGGYDDEPVHLDVSWTDLSNGSSHVSVDAGGDEAAMDFLINSDGYLVAFYQHNQSPDFGLFCENGEHYADEECGFLYLDSMLHHEDDETRGSEADVSAETARDVLSRVPFLAYEEYLRSLELPADTAVVVQFTTWDNPEGWGWDEAGRVTVQAEGQPAHHYEIAGTSSSQWIFTVKKGDEPTAFDCREL